MKTDIKNAKKFMESQGYEFEPDEFWADEYISNDHKWKDILYLMEEYADQRVKEAFHQYLQEPIEAAKEIENYLSDLDNLKDTGHFKDKDIGDFTFHHKGWTLKRFISKGREFIRLSLMREKQLNRKRD